MFNQIYTRKRVLVTGHTGFKGSWLCCWLKQLGAEVCGLSLPLETEPAHSDLLNLDIRSELCDIRDLEKVREIFQNFQPEIVFHLAAQPIVRLSYESPVETFASNVMGTVHVLEACRQVPALRGVVVISSDKCYENREWVWGYRENEPMGGYDPYSASKGCTELVTASYRRSFFHPDEFGKSHRVLVASARAGNVIGGGDWAPDRLVPDIMRAASAGQVSVLRNPQAVRPWQHVLEPLSGYLTLGGQLFQGRVDCAEGWNFGPEDNSVITVEDAAQRLAEAWTDIRYQAANLTHQPHEANLLRLDCSKARQRLQWHSVLTPQETFDLTASWYRQFYAKGTVLTERQINEYETKAKERKLAWAR